MCKSIAPTYIGLDVASRTISVALIRAGSELVAEERIVNRPDAVADLVRRWDDPPRLRACYEAGPTGYELQRQLASFGVDCSVVAPSLIPRRPARE